MTAILDPALLADTSGLWESSAIVVPVPRRATRWAKMLLGREQPIRWGSLRRTRPLSENYGLERGTPVDRVYIERFLLRHASDVRGRVLEVRDARYTLAHGGDRVTSSEIVDIDAGNEQATIVADLGAPNALPAGSFDCVILTQTLQYIAQPAVAIANVERALAPGGVALITAPSASQIDPHLAETDLWRFTPQGLAALVRANGHLQEVDVVGYGNVLASVTFLMGLVGEDLRTSELDDHDARFPLVACVRARKPGEPSRASSS
jgi:SAM-dependent methyltransferase